MRTLRSSDELFELVQRQVRSWSLEKRDLHGFGLLVPGNPNRHARRMEQARTVLAAQVVVEEFFSVTDTPMILMKGLEVAHLYPILVDRPFRDVDLLLSDVEAVWQVARGRGYRPDPARRVDIDHHHLPALAHPSLPIGLELHHRPNQPSWAELPSEYIWSTAQPSRTGINGVLRPRDDIHALLMAIHGWKGGFSRLRDLFDALLLESTSSIPVVETAERFGLRRFWAWTVRLAEAELFGISSRQTRLASTVLFSDSGRWQSRRRARVLAPYLAAGPVRVTTSHWRDYQLGREARRAI